MPAGALVVVVVCPGSVVSPGTVVVWPGTVVVAAGTVVVAAGTVVAAAGPAVVVVAPTAEVVTAAPSHGVVVVTAGPAHTAKVVAGVLSVQAPLVPAVVEVEVVRDCAETAVTEAAPNVTKIAVVTSATAIVGEGFRGVRSNFLRLKEEFSEVLSACPAAWNLRNCTVARQPRPSGARKLHIGTPTLTAISGRCQRPKWVVYDRRSLVQNGQFRQVGHLLGLGVSAVLVGQVPW